MGSSKPPNHDLPFGYSFDTSSSAFPFQSPPAPAPGPSLLDDNDTKFLDSFFDGVSEDHFNTDFFSNDGLNDLSFGWQELPSAFMGTSSSFGQQPLLPTNEMTNMSYPSVNDPIGMHSDGSPSNTAADVLAAAALLQNGRSQRLSDETLFTDPNLSVPIPPQSNGRNLMAYGSSRARPMPAKQDDYMRDTLYTEMIFGPSASDGRPQAKAPPSKAADIRWGSDAGFGSGQGFVAPPSQVSIETVEQNLMHVVECLEPEVSTAASTRPPSPMVSRHEPPRRQSSKTGTGGDEQVDDESRPKKRRKSKMKTEDDGEDEEVIALKAPRKRRPKSTASINPPPLLTMQSPLTAKRRKSAASSATKPPRENLTEDQKRENHIRSEQKRRTLIKEGFDDLGELVPDLRGGGHSKSAVLVTAADWLEDLIKGNKMLRARLQELEQQGKAL